MKRIPSIGVQTEDAEKLKKKPTNKQQTNNKNNNRKIPEQPRFSKILDFLYNRGVIKSLVTQRKAVRELLLM